MPDHTDELRHAVAATIACYREVRDELATVQTLLWHPERRNNALVEASSLLYRAWTRRLHQRLAVLEVAWLEAQQAEEHFGVG